MQQVSEWPYVVAAYVVVWVVLLAYGVFLDRRVRRVDGRLSHELGR
jgi:CcmD family protein